MVEFKMTPKQEAALRQAREAFIKRGFWPNEIMWECWKDAWIAGATAEREELARFFEEHWRAEWADFQTAEAIRARNI